MYEICCKQWECLPIAQSTGSPEFWTINHMKGLSWWFQIFFWFSPLLGLKWSNLTTNDAEILSKFEYPYFFTPSWGSVTNMFQMGWDYQRCWIAWSCPSPPRSNRGRWGGGDDRMMGWDGAVFLGRRNHGRNDSQFLLHNQRVKYLDDPRLISNQSVSISEVCLRTSVCVNICIQYTYIYIHIFTHINSTCRCL